MNRLLLLKEITSIFREVLDNDTISIDETVKASDIEDWDSLTHIELIIAIEKKFKIRFNTKEINSWENVGAMCISIDRLLEDDKIR